VHDAREVGEAGGDLKVVVIPQKDEGVEVGAEALEGFNHEAEEGGVVLGGMEEALAVVSAGDDMVAGLGMLDASLAAHMGSFPSSRTVCERRNLLLASASTFTRKTRTPRSEVAIACPERCSIEGSSFVLLSTNKHQREAKSLEGGRKKPEKREKNAEGVVGKSSDLGKALPGKGLLASLDRSWSDR
jgi:hypothetical protein